MKSIIILILSSVSFLFSNTINECKSDIYFINGVWNTKREALSSVDKLTRILLYSNIQNKCSQ